MKLDTVIDTVKATVPSCIAAAAVDIASGMLLAVRTDPDHRTPDLDQLAAAAEQVFLSATLGNVGRAFAEGSDGTTREAVLVTDSVVVVFQRCRRKPGVAVVMVSKSSANLGMVLARARQAIANAESVIVSSLTP